MSAISRAFMKDRLRKTPSAPPPPLRSGPTPHAAHLGAREARRADARRVAREARSGARRIP